jgi:uncharacterized membrane protein (UPF0127 family)
MAASDGPDTVWVLRDGDVLAAAQVAESLPARVRGLLGRSGYEGALFLPHTRAVHTVGMRFAIDVAFLDGSLNVLDVVRLPPWRMTRPRLRCRGVLEAEAGAFERWRLRPGDQLEIRRPS